MCLRSPVDTCTKCARDLAVCVLVGCAISEIEKRRDDPFQMLEYGGADKQRAEASKPAMQRLLSMSERGQRDYSLNKSLRRAMRVWVKILFHVFDCSSDIVSGDFCHEPCRRFQ